MNVIFIFRVTILFNMGVDEIKIEVYNAMGFFFFWFEQRILLFSALDFRYEVLDSILQTWAGKDDPLS